MTELTGIYGGTFDPVHHGHLACARYVLAHCPLQAIRLMPCHLPPHRASPGVSAAHRAAMVKLAIANEPQMQLELSELERNSPSYTVDSLQHLRAQGLKRLAFIIGMDSLHYFTQWHQWQQILQQAHLIVCQRSGYSATKGDAPALLERYGISIEAMQQQPHGGIVLLDNPDFAGQASSLRQQLADGQTEIPLIAPAVLNYIQQHRLYTACS
ncbi:nicotinate-nucleotide adenylyltransferase [Arsukibacterium sp.]|uniref:nicotinate-nucleotide adenylyltransferase n=1 Tax=Arsukibacterium sp. TaxID=1977258 RepID=UPI002FD94A86